MNDQNVSKMSDIEIIKKIEADLGIEFKETDKRELTSNSLPTYTIDKYKRVVCLKINDLELKKIISELKKFNYIEKLILNSCELSSIDFISKMQKLAYLELSDNKIRDISTLKNCKYINTLILAENHIFDISALAELKNLVQLDLHDNKIYSVSALAELKYISLLDLKENEVKNVNALENLTNLVELNLTNNDIESLTPLKKLTKLTRLSANLNRIRKVDALSGLNKLRSLSLRDNKIIDINPLGELIDLEKLNLWDNNIKDIAVLEKLTKLTYLNLSENYIKAVNSLAGLHQLRILGLMKNEIKDISILKNLKKLEKIDVRSNRIKRITQSLAENLSEVIYSDSWDYHGINLYENPLELPPVEIVKQKKQAVLNFYKELQEGKGTDILNEVKLILVGEERAGKSSIAEALSNPLYEFSHKQTTEGIDIIKWILPAESVKEYANLRQLKENNFRVNIWDFGGQEIYHATHQFFLTRHSIYLLVVEARRDVRHVDFFYWLNIIKVLSNNSPVIIILNKSDLPHKSLPVLNYQENFPNIVKYKEISCKDDFKHTIEALRESIKRIIFDKKLLPEIGITLPKVWVDIRKRLEKLRLKGKNYISINLYFEICADYGLNEERALFLSGYFHQIGVFLHFQDDVHLSDTIFLNHEWVTAGVYSVLDDKQTIKNKGRFTGLDLIRIWDKKGYEDKRGELLSLMRNDRFSICFELAPNVYLAPQLLMEESIDYEWRTNAGNLEFEFRYEFMPKGLLTQFIAVSHKEIVGENYWRYGVLLEYENTRAIVREYYFDKKIKIKIEGENKKDFLGIIRKNIKEINNTFQNLNVFEMIPCNCRTCSKGNPHFYNYNHLKKRLHKGKSTIECYNSYENVSIYSLLFDVVSDNIQTQDIIMLISKNELRKAIEQLLQITKNDDEVIYNQVVLISAKYNALMSRMNEGTLSEQEISLQKAKVRKSLLTVINQLNIEI